VRDERRGAWTLNLGCPRCPNAVERKGARLLSPPVVVVSQANGPGGRSPGRSRGTVGITLRARRGRLPGVDKRTSVVRAPIERRRTSRGTVGAHRRGRTLVVTAILPVRSVSQCNGHERNPQQGHRRAQPIWSRCARHMMTCRYFSDIPYIPLERRVPAPALLFNVSLRIAAASVHTGRDSYGPRPDRPIPDGKTK
jgi:hypothetical protein